MGEAAKLKGDSAGRGAIWPNASISPQHSQDPMQPLPPLREQPGRHAARTPCSPYLPCGSSHVPANPNLDRHIQSIFMTMLSNHQLICPPPPSMRPSCPAP